MLGLNLWPLLLPVAATSGWWFGSSRQENDSQSQKNFLSREYFVGLNYLLNEQPDKAVDIFIKLLEVDGDTVETHLALGSLFRRRGEVDRAIRIHQNLIARPQLSRQQRVEAMVSLGHDYMRAGVLDRAERIFREVVDIGGEHTTTGLRYLLDIYQQEKAWKEAIAIVAKLERVAGEQMHTIVAHHYCELAEIALNDNKINLAKGYLRQAVVTDKNSVRASLLQAKMEQKQQNYKVAIKYYKQVKLQDPDFISEAIQLMGDCYKALDDETSFIQYLQETLDEYPRISIVLSLAEHMHNVHGTDVAADFVAEQLNRYPSLRGLNKLIEWHIATTEGKVRDKLQMLQALTSKLLANRPIYRCESCGFAGRQLHWYCAGCKKWSSIKPIHGLEGD